MRTIFSKFSGLLGYTALVFLCLASPAFAAFETPAKQAYMVDLSTNTVLLEKNAGERMTPSSMTKMMTMYLVFEKLKAGKIALDDAFLASEKAWKAEGSRMWVKPGERVRLEDLIRGVIVQSGNDACIVLAEGLAGSEESFAEAMNAKAAEMGLKDTHFLNASGLPIEGHYSSARDLAILAQRLMKDFPEYYHYYSEKEFTYNGIKQGNRNPLLYRNMGADGVKTGHTEEAGFGMTASVVRGDRHLLLVVNGLKDMQKRADETVRIIEWGFHDFQNYALAESNAIVATIPVNYGKQDVVTVTIPRAIKVTLPGWQRDKILVKVTYDSPVVAPIKKGDTLGKLLASVDGVSVLEAPLVAGSEVPAVGFFGRIWSNLGKLFG